MVKWLLIECSILKLSSRRAVFELRKSLRFPGKGEKFCVSGDQNRGKRNESICLIELEQAAIRMPRKPELKV
jgi:hypothetical protein